MCESRESRFGLEWLWCEATVRRQETSAGRQPTECSLLLRIPSATTYISLAEIVRSQELLAEGGQAIEHSLCGRCWGEGTCDSLSA